MRELQAGRRTSLTVHDLKRAVQAAPQCFASSGRRCYAPTVPSYIKKAGKPPVAPQSDETRWVVAEMLAEIEKRGEEAGGDHARKPDPGTADIGAPPAE